MKTAIIVISITLVLVIVFVLLRPQDTSRIEKKEPQTNAWDFFSQLINRLHFDWNFNGDNSDYYDDEINSFIQDDDFLNE